MSTDTAYSAIKTFLDANWTTTPLAYENTQYPLADTPVAFVMVEISGNTYRQASIGGATKSANLWRESGLLWLHVMVASGTGSLTARQYARQLIELLRGAELASGTLHFGDASVGLGEAQKEDGNYWGVSTSIEWILDN